MHTLPSIQQLKNQLPISSKAQKTVSLARQKARNILEKKDTSLVFILGPCSIHDTASAVAFGKHVLTLQREFPHFFFVMRTFIEKARTTHGWKGLIYDPEIDGSCHMEKGIFETRSLFLSLAELEIPTACEFVDPILSYYFSDLVTWGFIGARTSASQPHRQFGSSLSYPIGFKNAVDGNIDVAIQGAISASHAHTHVTINQDGMLAQISSKGNPYSHIVLRGSMENPNYDDNSVQDAIDRLQEYQVAPRILIDCSHGNSSRIASKQKDSFSSVIEQIKNGNDHIIGVMLESFLEEGKQTPSPPFEFGKSITDDCLGIEDTKELIKWADERLFSTLMNTKCKSLA